MTQRDDTDDRSRDDLDALLDEQDALEDGRGMDPTGMRDHEANLPDGVVEEYREITDDDLASVGEDQSTLGVQGGGVDDLPDDLDDQEPVGEA